MGDVEADIKKNLVEALKMLGIDLDDDLKIKKKTPEEEYEDYTELSYKTRAKIDELNEKGEQLLEKTGMTKEALETYGSNPNNFTADQWEALQKIRQATEDYKRISPESLAQDLKEVEATEKKKKPARSTKKKDWKPI